MCSKKMGVQECMCARACVCAHACVYMRVCVHAHVCALLHTIREQLSVLEGSAMMKGQWGGYAGDSFKVFLPQVYVQRGRRMSWKWRMFSQTLGRFAPW